MGNLTFLEREILNKVYNSSNTSLQVDIVDATGVTFGGSSKRDWSTTWVHLVDSGGTADSISRRYLSIFVSSKLSVIKSVGFI